MIVYTLVTEQVCYGAHTRYRESKAIQYCQHKADVQVASETQDKREMTYIWSVLSTMISGSDY